MPAVPILSAVRATLAGMALAVLATLALASPAAAHDELVGSTPGSGQKLDAAPTEVVLTYSAAIETQGAIVAVLDADGRDWTAGEHVIDTNTLTVLLAEGLPDAGYVVEWRVVSSDGHPISGSVPFRIGDGAPVDPSDVVPAADTDTSEASALPVVVAAVVVAAAAIVIGVLVVRRRTAQRRG
ncbi:copper resistance protein CopC [Microbacterium sp. EYE_5]|uniref:copper resistance CopC family protein n=1 Tax=unclassified Microbacterium TaxID=2609290 RepID=UPI0020030190|nr:MULTISPECIES: copper resistance CopC family protein [unclassified Microbacterium]MCK6081073.1 copper resistance protein CopC [Microbacterium sp. EYE_382]MCK6086343.1 copper resistance protein CopC [Microbacterium sp. EYE_384]MCK6124159.1 copper resistance protein CopC [Microbacterium sp. EYE_80]MCK6127068.1 copper resistance protein CopC [Microbacterium sp. EYE_79]MCK6142028.1 copper resistance protein CopC [Microbacterium sp. EYE_39]